MGFRMRKSINLGGGFRINLSQSGIGYSWGVPGYRITQTSRGTIRQTYSIPGTGISYTQGSHNNDPQVSQSIYSSSVRNIESADVDMIKSASTFDITKRIEKTISKNTTGTAFLFVAILGFLHPIFLVFPVVGFILKIISHTKGVVKLEYSFDDDQAATYNSRIDAWEVLSTNEKLWQIIQEQDVSNVKNNAGASRNLKRVPFVIKNDCPYYIKTNVEVIQLKLKKERILILPDKIFVIQNSKIGVVDYSQVEVSLSKTNFIESDSVASDTQVVGTTWQYVNKNGTPDRRFNNNRQLPICLYGDIKINSPEGINVELQCSSLKKAQAFAAHEPSGF